MSDDDLNRVKEDLAAVQRAAGFELPYGQEEVRANLMLAAGGAVAVGWALVPHGLPAQWGMVPLIVLAVVHVVRMRARYRRSTGRSPIRRREYTAGLVGMVVVGGLAVVYRLWATKLGISLTVAGGAALFLLGLSMILPVLKDRGRMPDLGIAVPLILCGLAIPLCPVSLWILVGAAFVVGGAAAALLTAHQLRGSVAGHAAN